MGTSHQLQQTPHVLSYPHRWSELLTPGPSCLCKEFSQDVRHNLWQNQLWHKRKAAKEVLSESDDEESQHFGIRQEIGDGNDSDAGEEEDADVLPLYGQDDNDFGDSSSEVSWGFNIMTLVQYLTQSVSKICYTLAWQNA